ncbi:MAG: hypothetical protein M1837_002853 [Sclerophora amabilis]|nr:MAG: hypothetical protein M1837_002853 [Sclerophora amabilis]
MAAAKPTVIFIPGAWHSPGVFQDVSQKLNQRGYPTTGLILPGVGAEPPTRDVQDDVRTIQSSINLAVDRGQNVVLVMHSYGGIPGGSSVEGFTKSHRAKVGKTGAVVACVYISAFALQQGESLLGFSQGRYSPWINVEGDRLTVDPIDADRVFYGKTSDPNSAETLGHTGTKLPHQCRATFETPATYEPWPEVPCTYLLCEADEAIPPLYQRAMVSRVEGCHVVSCGCSHSPFLDDPDMVAEVIDAAAQKANGQDPNV